MQGDGLASAAVLEYVSDICAELRELPMAAIDQLVGLLERTYRADRTIFVFGNGGSAATASHFACDLAKNTRCAGTRPIRAMSLNDQVPALTAFANDEGYDSVFAGQLQALARPGDVAIGISTSGNSPNILNGLRWAAAAGLVTVGLLGRPGGLARDLADLSVLVPGSSIEQQEDIHLILAHAITRHLRATIARLGRP